MSRSALVGNVTAMLEDAGFRVSARCAIRPKSFDVVARRGEDLLLVKILGNIDGFDSLTGGEMRRLGEYLNATPIVVGLRTRDEDLQPGVVYFRHGVPVLSPDTAMDLFVEEVPPLIYAAPGGLYVNIESETLVEERESRDWSLGRLAKELGVSRRTISKYEEGMNASIEIAMELEELFETPLATPVDVLEGAEQVREADETPTAPEMDPNDSVIVTIMTDAGYQVHPTAQSPFEAVSEDEEGPINVLTGHSKLTDAAKKRAKIMSSIGEVAGTRSVYFVEQTDKESIDGTALLSRKEVDNLSDVDELRRVIKSRSAPIEHA